MCTYITKTTYLQTMDRARVPRVPGIKNYEYKNKLTIILTTFYE